MRLLKEIIRRYSSIVQNMEAWKVLEKEKKLHSSLKDGTPQTIPQKILAHLYPIVLFCLASIVGIVGIVNIEWVILNKWKLIKVFLIGTFAGGFLYGPLMQHWDNVPGWLYHPFSYSGIDIVNSLEDWCFYPLCGLFYIVIFEWFDHDDMELIKQCPYLCESAFYHKLINSISLVSMMLLFLFLVVNLSTAGMWISAIVLFIPGIIMFYYNLDKIDSVHFIKCSLFFISFATIWDYVQVTLIHNYIAWAEGWLYVSFVKAGEIGYQSDVFSPYVKGSWKWFFGYSPFEITPWFAVSGNVFIYSLWKTIKGDRYKL